MHSNAWSWRAQAANAQLPEARRQEARLWPSAVLADVPGWGGFEAQPSGAEWPHQTGSQPEAPALRHAATDADEQQLAEQVRPGFAPEPVVKSSSGALQSDAVA